MDTNRKLKKAKIDVMRSDLPGLRLWAGLMSVGKTTIDETNTVVTACTNGRDEIYGKAFVDLLPVPQLAFVALHEAMHKGLRHLTTWKRLWETDRHLANISCVPEGTKVTMADGTYLPVEQVRAGAYVKSPLGPARVFLVSAATKQDMVEIDLVGGYKVTVTVDHRILTNAGFVEAGQIAEGTQVAVDAAGGPVSQGQLRHHESYGHGRKVGADVLKRVADDELLQDTPAGVDYTQGGGEAGVPQDIATHRLGVPRGYNRRGGYDNDGAVPRWDNTSCGEGLEYELCPAAISGETRVPLDAPQQFGRTEVLHHRSVGVQHRTLIDWDAAVFGNQEAIGRMALGDYIDTSSNAVQLETFRKNVGVAGAYKGYEYARVTAVRRFAQEQRVFDLTTSSQTFEANGVVVHNCDYVVNRMIVQADPNGKVVQFPRNPDGSRMGVYDEKGQFNGMSAKQIFDILRQEQQGQPGQGQGQPGQGQPGQGQGQPGQGQPGQGQPGQGQGQPQGFDEHDWEKANALSPEEKQALEREVDHALRRGEAEAKKCGGGKSDIPAEIGELLRPAIDWRQALREFITAACANKDQSSWRRLNRRYHSMDLSLPSLYGEALGHIVVGADLSGSMWSGRPSPISRIFTEIVEIADAVSPERMDVLYWDTGVAGHDTFRRGEYEGLLQRAKPKGGGGTDAACVPRYLKDEDLKPDCIVMVTDGYLSSWGTQYPAPVLWVVIDNPKTDAPVGKTVHVRD